MLLALDTWIWFPFWMGLGLSSCSSASSPCGGAAGGHGCSGSRSSPSSSSPLFLNVVYIKGILDISLGRQASWRHVVPPAPTGADRAAGRAGMTSATSW